MHVILVMEIVMTAEYYKLKKFIKRLPHAVCLRTTATHTHNQVNLIYTLNSEYRNLLNSLT